MIELRAMPSLKAKAAAPSVAAARSHQLTAEFCHNHKRPSRKRATQGRNIEDHERDFSPVAPDLASLAHQNSLFAGTIRPGLLTRPIECIVQRVFENATDFLCRNGVAFTHLPKIDACGAAYRVNEGGRGYCVQGAAGEGACDWNELDELAKPIANPDPKQGAGAERRCKFGEPDSVPGDLVPIRKRAEHQANKGDKASHSNNRDWDSPRGACRSGIAENNRMRFSCNVVIQGIRHTAFSTSRKTLTPALSSASFNASRPKFGGA